MGDAGSVMRIVAVLTPDTAEDVQALLDLLHEASGETTTAPEV